MNNDFKLKKSIRLVTATLASSVAMAGVVSAEDSIFSAQELPTDYMIAGSHMDGKCGEGKCGERTKEGKCGAMMHKDMSGKCGEAMHRSMEGKCGEAMHKSMEGMCGESMHQGGMEGKCGEMHEAMMKSSSKERKCDEGKCGEGKCGESMEE